LSKEKAIFSLKLTLTLYHCFPSVTKRIVMVYIHRAKVELKVAVLQCLLLTPLGCFVTWAPFLMVRLWLF